MRLSDIHRRVQAQPSKFLLDVAPNAAQAYSLRLLREDYTGFCIRIARIAGQEQDIGFINGFVDTNAILNFANTGNAYVMKWYDQSGNNNDLSTTVLQNPILLSNNFIVNNGKICVKINTGFTYSTNNALSNQFYSSAILNVDPSQTGFRGVFSSSNINLSINNHMLLSNTTQNKWGTFGSSTQNANSLLVGQGTNMIAMESFNGLSGAFYLNNQNDGIFNSTVSQNTRHIGGISGQFTVMFFHEFVYYNNVSFNRSIISNNINDYYNIF